MAADRNTGLFPLRNAPQWALPRGWPFRSNPVARWRAGLGPIPPPWPRFFRNRYLWQAVLVAGMLATGIVFLHHQRADAVRMLRLLHGVHPGYLALGAGLTGLYVLCQGWMYVGSFAALGKKIPLGVATSLFLKRNLVSVLLPAGAFSSLAFFTRDLSNRGLTQVQVHLASFLFAFCSLVSVVVVAVPALAYSLLQGSLHAGEAAAFGFLVLLTGGLAWAARSLRRRGYAYRQLVQRRPAWTATWDALRAQPLSRRKVIQTCLVSVGIEGIGIAHLYIAMPALGLAPSLPAALIGYVVMVLLLIASPVLRGLGAIEVSVAYVLMHFGLPLAAAGAVTLLFRFFEFWLPLGAGLLVLLARRDNVLLRVFPAGLTCLLGVVNVLSTLAPAGPAGSRLLREIIPVGWLHASNSLVLGAGILLIILSVYLLRGSRNAWWMTLALAALSVVLNVAVAQAYAEALAGMAVLGTLLYTRRQYCFGSSPQNAFLGFNTLACSLGGVLLYGTLGFYLLDERHFGVHFTWDESIRSLMRVCLLFNDDHLTPLTPCGRGFLHTLYAGSIGTMAFTAYFFLKPFVYQPVHEAEESGKARELVRRHGRSALDYFKTYFDKYIFFAPGTEAFVAYRVAHGYAVVLEDPVCAGPEALRDVVRAFDAFCLRN
ncbi:MAG TPA: lysylphosphatidylglycerol synthase domain-containing protein, partial [Cytophagales bacterium]